MDMKKKPLLKCLMCEKYFTEEDVRKLNYFPNTGICYECYKDGQEQKYSHWCFGKDSLIVAGQTVGYGYDADASDCKNDCPDRKICPLFVTGKIDELRRKASRGAEMKKEMSKTKKVFYTEVGDEVEVSPKTEGRKFVEEEEEEEMPKKKAPKQAVAAPKKGPAKVAKKAAPEAKARSNGAVRDLTAKRNDVLEFVGKNPTKKNPFIPDTGMAKLFEAMVKGVKADGGLELLAKKLGLQPRSARVRLIACGRSFYRPIYWELVQEGAKEKIVFVK